MKITVNINLGGHVFNFDEDAYAELKSYMRSLELSFGDEESLSEIMSDIESRMAELLKDKITTYKQVITIEDVREVIKIMGRPEDFGNDDSHYRQGRDFSGTTNRMYRDPDKRIIGGVCSGVACYWGIDPWIIRGIFLLLLLPGGLGALIYLLLWIVLPEAKSTAQKIEMKGDPVNIHNIKESVKNEFNRVRKNMNL